MTDEQRVEVRGRSRRALISTVTAVLLLTVCGLGVLLLRESLPSPDSARSLPADPATIDPPSSKEPSGPAVTLEVGDDFQQIVDDQPQGTRFVIQSGLHRLQEVVPRDGDSFVGEPGAILSGAADISSGVVEWQAADGFWYVEDQVTQSTPHGEVGENGNDRIRFGEEVFVDDRRFTHVDGMEALGPGSWFPDYETGRLWLGEDPAALGTIETSVAEEAFSGSGVSDVTLSNIVVEKYANRSSWGAINALNTSNWTIQDCTSRLNHGAGVSLGPGSTLERCELHDNGQLGVKAVGTYRQGDRDGQSGFVTVRSNDIHDNNVLGFDTGWEAGGAKFAESASGILVENNWSHDNDGPGLWFDVYNRSATVRSNLIERNATRGLFYEISYGPTEIYWNTIRDNGAAAEPRLVGAGIFLSNSTGVEVYGNLISGSPHGILIRAAGDRDPLVSDLFVHDNDVTVAEAWSGMYLDRGADTSLYTSGAVRFQANAYRLDNPATEPFFWNGQELTVGEWQAAGNDTAARILDRDAAGRLPVDAQGFEPIKTGPR